MTYHIISKGKGAGGGPPPEDFSKEVFGRGRL